MYLSATLSYIYQSYLPKATLSYIIFTLAMLTKLHTTLIYLGYA